MAKETGVVLRLDGETAWVGAQQNSACASCSARDSCGTHGPRTFEVQALNGVGALLGDRVELVCETGPLLRATFLVYLLPVIGLLSGAALGHWLGEEWGYDPSPMAVTLGAAGLAAAMVAVRHGGSRLSRQAAYRPKISRILARAAVLQGEAACGSGR